MINLSQLAIYPIKSTAQVSLPRAQISPFGLNMDRRWMLVDQNSVMLTQRNFARMCLIQSRFDNGVLEVTAPEMPGLTISLNNETTQTRAIVWEDTCKAEDCGDVAADWFSEFLGTPARLVYFPENTVRQVDLNYAKQGDVTAFSDGFPYLLISQASLDDLNSRLKQRPKQRQSQHTGQRMGQNLEQPVSTARFRPNLVVTGSAAFAEDSWKKLRIGNVIFNLVKPCSRCVIPSINPQTAEKSAEVVKTLASYRMRENKIFFGQNLIAQGSGELEVGMPVEILE